jgi:Sulfatase-modifying factor enzyme 1
VDLPGVDTVDARRAFVSLVGIDNLRSHLSWEGSNYEFFNRLIIQVSLPGKESLLKFLSNVSNAPQVGIDRKERIALVYAAIQPLDDHRWRREFGTSEEASTLQPLRTIFITGILAFLLAIVINLAVNVFPENWQPYLWLSWPLTALCAGIGVSYAIRLPQTTTTTSTFPKTSIAQTIRSWFIARLVILSCISLIAIGMAAYTGTNWWLYFQARDIVAHQISGLDVQFELYEVTNQRYRLCVRAGYCIAPAPDNSTYWQQGAEQIPITGIDAHQAMRFCHWIGRRLPTRYEWEQAALRAPWGDRAPTPAEANLDLTELGLTSAVAPVGNHPQGATADGVQDLIGNVLEWTATIWPDTGLDARVWNGESTQENTMLTVIGGSYRTSYYATNAVQASMDIDLSDLGVRCVQ